MKIQKSKKGTEESGKESGTAVFNAAAGAADSTGLGT